MLAPEGVVEVQVEHGAVHIQEDSIDGVPIDHRLGYLQGDLVQMLLTIGNINHSDCHRFSRYLIPDFSPLFRKNTLGLNDCVH